MRWFKRLVLFIVGFCSYVTIEVLFRGYSYPLMGCCGGLLLLLLDPINDRMSWEVDLLLYGCIGSAIVTSMELFIGETIKCVGLTPMWDYSNLPLSYDGVICVPFSLIWVALSIVGIFLTDAINYYVFEDTTLPHYYIFGKLLFVFKKKKCMSEHAE
jgi:uncharacterized membrane protein